MAENGLQHEQAGDKGDSRKGRFSNIPPNPQAALRIIDHVHDHCLLMRDLLRAVSGGKIEGAELRGLDHVFENIMADLECAASELDPA